MAKQVITLEVVGKGFSDAKSSLGSIAAAAAAVGAAVLIANKAFDLFGRGLKESLELGIQFVRSQALIKDTLSLVGADIDKVSGKLLKFARYMSLNTEASLGQVQTLQAVASGMLVVGDPALINKVVKASMAMTAAIPGTDAQENLKSVIKSMSGYVKGNLAAIPGVKALVAEQRAQGKQINVLDLLIKKFSSAMSAAVDTVSGRWNNLGTVIRDSVLTTLGRVVTQSQATANALRVLTEEIDRWVGNTDKRVSSLQPIFEMVARIFLQTAQYGIAMTSILLRSFNTLIRGAEQKMMALVLVFENVLFKPIAKALSVLAKMWPEKFGGALAAVTGVLDSLKTAVYASSNAIEATAKASDAAGTAVAKMVLAFDEAQGSSAKVAASQGKWNDKALAAAASARKAANEIRKLNEAMLGVGEAVADEVEALDEKEKSQLANTIEKALKARADAQKKFDDDLVKSKKETAKALAEIRENEAKADAVELGKKVARYQKAAGFIQVGFSSLFANMQDENKTTSEKIKDTIKDVAMAVFKSSLANVVNLAVQAAVGGAKAVAGIPIIGPVLALAASGAILVAMLAMKGKLKPPSMAFGGRVHGGAVATDSVPINAMPGEVVLNRRQARDYENYKNGLQGRGGGNTFNLQMSPLVGNKIENQRWTEDVIVKALESAARRGKLRNMLSAAGAM